MFIVIDGEFELNQKRAFNHFKEENYNQFLSTQGFL